MDERTQRKTPGEAAGHDTRDAVTSATVSDGRAGTVAGSGTASSSASGFTQTIDPTVPTRAGSGALRDPIHWPAPTDWGRYVPVEPIGIGGMGAVFKAWDPRLKRHVAVKFLTGDHPELLQRFVREAQAQARVEHPNVCKVYEVGEVAGRPYIAMQLIAGEPLSRLQGRLSLERTVLIVKAVAEATQAAHQIGLIHRDLKPANVMVETGEDGRDRPYVVDFGLVRDIGAESLTVEGHALGTPSFMAPEQARGELASVDRRSDVYGLGATLYAALSGAPPFEGTTPIAVIRQVLDEEPRPLRLTAPKVPADLESVVMRCLEKQPGRRYDSARALADDLGRFLSGEPVLAKPVSMSYRLGKTLRKHKALAAVTAAALLTTTVLAGAVLHSRWTSARQAALAQRFGQDATEIESILRFAHLMPLHDTRPERRAVRERMAALEARLRNLGDAGQGPGHLALGRAWMSLRDYRTARTHLEAAWHTHGYREPEVAWALGLTLASLYRDEAAATERITIDEIRVQRGAVIDRELRGPARHYLERSRDARLDAPEYLEATLAFLERRHDVALRQAEAAERALPWLYEATRLAGDVHLALAREAEQAARLEDAAASYAKAGEAYSRATRVAESDEEVLLADAEHWLELTVLELSRGTSPTRFVEATLATCDGAITANPDTGRGYLLKALALVRLGSFQRTNASDDPTPVLTEAARLAHMAIERSPRDPEAFAALGMAHAQVATYLVDHLGDPESSLRLAIAALEEALRLDPRASGTHNALGNVYWDLGAAQSRHGVDPGDAFRKARESFEAALAITPGLFGTLNNLGGLQTWIADLEEAAGRDPRPLLRLAITNYEAATRLRPRSPSLHSGTATVYTQLGVYEMTHGADPGDAFEVAAASNRTALALDPTFYFAWINLGDALVGSARLCMVRGQDPRPVLKEAAKAFEAGLQVHPGSAPLHVGLGEVMTWLARHELAAGRNPSIAIARGTRALREATVRAPDDYQAHRDLGRLEILAARWAMRSPSSPAAHLAAARTELERALALNASEPGVFIALAEHWRWQAEWLLLRGASATDALRAGLEAAEKARLLARASAEAFAVTGALHVLQARSENAPPESLARGREALAEALAQSPELVPDYRQLLEEGGRSSR